MLGLIAIADELRPEAAAVVEYLDSKNIETWMITGDNDATAQSIASQCGIRHVLSQVLPGQKQEQVKLLQQAGKTVCFVGDGVNDSPALTQSDVAIAVGTGERFFFFKKKKHLTRRKIGTDVAMASADMVLMKNDLRDVIVALEVARSTYNRIRINFFWAFLYNMCGIPLAAGVLYPLIKPLVVPPAIAGLAMALSSVTVVLSSLTLKLWKAPVIGTSSSRIPSNSFDLEAASTDAEDVPLVE